MKISNKIKKEIHDNIISFASKQEDIILQVYNSTFKDLNEEQFNEEQQEMIITNVLKNIFSSFDNAITQQKEAVNIFFKDKSNLTNIIETVNKEKTRNE